MVVEYKYDAWGKPIATTGSMAATLGKRNPFRYRGYIYDEETGLYYNGSRYYNPESIRFVNADDANIIEEADDLLVNNLFAYCLNNPVVLADYDGEAAVNIIGGIFGGVTGAALGVLLAKILGLRGFAKAALIAACTVAGATIGAIIGPKVAKFAKAISGSVKAAASSFLKVAAKAATKAARNVGRFTVSAKHLASAGGRYAKFATTSQSVIRSLIRTAISSSSAQFLANGTKTDSFILIYRFANAIGTKGEKCIKIVISTAGKIITAYPCK